METGQAVIGRIVQYIVDPALKVLFTLALLLFFVGIVEFLISLRNGSADRTGKDHMLYGMAGLVIMVSVYSIITIIANTFGVDIANPDVSRINQVIPDSGFMSR